MKCPRCGNEDPSWFYKGAKGWYCRRCVRFRRILVMDEPAGKYPDSPAADPEYVLRFELTKAQKRVSEEVLGKVCEGRSVLVNAVCGAGKTELVYASIYRFLKESKRVGFAISRRQVVLQVAERLRRDFPKLKVVPVCQGFTKDTKGDLIVCTAHQLYRYPSYFDLLILDEPDAYPFSGNEVLQGIAEHAVNGPMIFLTATPDKWVRDKVKRAEIDVVDLPVRPTGHPLAVPVCRYLPGWLLPGALLKYMKAQKERGRYTIVYFPTIRECEEWAKRLKEEYAPEVITSHTDDKDAVVDLFMEHKTHFLFATTILERGVTFPGIDIAVYKADHGVYTTSTLVQIMGRVGRDYRDPAGDGIFLCAGHSEPIEECIRIIKTANTQAGFGGKA